MSKVLKVISRARERKLHRLQLGDFSETALPEAIGELKHLEEIHISGCPNLAALPDSLFELPALKKLTVVHSALTTLPDSIGQLHTLTYLRIVESRLTQLPESIGGLLLLEHLTIARCRLALLPDSLGNLRSLTELKVLGNQLSTIPETVGRLKTLHTLYAAGNWLQVLPDSIGGLERLHTLILSGNFLKSLPPTIGELHQLRSLQLSNNKLHTLPESLRQLQKLDALEVRGNQGLGLPAEVVNKAPTVILDFFFRSARRRKLNEAKILLIGQGGVGKTSLVNRLLDGTFNEEEAKTEGIRVRNWSVGTTDEIRLNVWDFGGQEIMHATHQFFLTKRSLYILVLDARAGEKESNIHYWLEMIRVYGENSPVIVVLNKSEQHYEQLDENRLKIDYEGAVNFVGFHEVSCKTGAGLAKLRSEIESAIRKMPHVSDYLPEDYFAVKEEMETRAARTDFITEQEYAEACKNHGVYDLAEQIRLLRFLHDLGCVLHYDDPEQRYHVHDTRVLNPEWVTGGVYRVLNDVELLREGDGIVRRSDFRRLLDPNRYPQHRYPFLIEIMKKYELCIEFPDDTVKVLVPELLSKNEPDVGWARKNQGDVLEFQYHYSVLPRGLVPRFIVRTQHLLTKQPTVWRAGVVLSVEGCRVLVRGDIRLAKVFIQVQGLRDSRRRALAVVRDLFAAVHLSYGDLNAEAKVPLPGDPGAPPVDYRHLVKLERQSIAEYWFEKAQRPYNVRELLDGIDERRFDVFLSHNSIDKPAVRELAKRLQVYGVRYWLDEEHLTPGETWQKELASAIRECRTILVLVGAQGVGPWEAEESAIGLDHAARGKKRVIPVLLPRAPKLSELPAQFDFLASRTWIEFKEEFSEAIVSRLARAIMEH